MLDATVNFFLNPRCARSQTYDEAGNMTVSRRVIRISLKKCRKSKMYLLPLFIIVTKLMFM